MKGAFILTRMCFTAGLLFSASQAQTINLTGTVRDSSTLSGIRNAVVKVVGLNDSTVTDTNGAYTITNSAARLPGPAGARLVAAPYLSRNALCFGVQDDATLVRIDLFDFSGRHVASLVDKTLLKGNYRIVPYSPSLSSQVYFVRIKTGSTATILKLPCLGRPHPSSEGALIKINDGNAGNSLAKNLAANDTITVYASGYLIARKPVTSYTGANDFSLVWSGAGGSILFDNASYQGCQYPAYLSVTDSSIYGPSLIVRVRSTTNPTGFSLSLKPVAGVAGTYADSLYFSISKSDSTKGILRVQDMDSVIASYDHGAPSHPASLRTTATVWSGTAGQIGPGASQYFGLRAKMQINLFDGDLTDSTAVITVKSPKDTVGISLTLRALPGNPGSFTRALGFSLTASIPDSVLAVDGRDSMGQLITMIYHDATPQATLYGSICTWIPEIGTLFLDSTAYHGTTDKMGITLIDDDILDSFAVVTVKSKKDATGIRDTLKADPQLVGHFEGQIGFSTTTSAARVIAVSNGDSVTVTYQDDTPIKSVITQASWNAN
jgi:hypothetical protein